MQTSAIAKELVLVGGGHSHVLALRMLGMKPIPGLQITLISPSVKTPYSGMLPGMVAGHYSEDDIHIDLVPLCKFAGARFIQSEVTGLDPDLQILQIKGRPDMAYDLVSLDIGITPAINEVPGAAGNVIAVKPIDQFLNHWVQFRERVLSNSVKELGFVGAGAGGVELCLAIHHRLQLDIGVGHVLPKFHLFHDGDSVLREYSPEVQKTFSEILQVRGIKVWPDFRVSRVEGKTLYSARQEEVSLDEVFWITAAAPQAWLQTTGLQLDEGGFIAVDDTLQSLSHATLLAVGDVAHVVKHPRPKAGVYAVRQGPPLAENLRRLLLGQSPKPFQPQSEFLSLISTGDKSAIAYRNGRSIKGSWVWRWKDWVDRRFMNRFTNYPVMKVEKPNGLLDVFDEQMQCGGCGSKVSAQLLSEVLNELGVGGRLRDDAAVYEVPAGKVMLHTIDSFRSFVDDAYVFAQVAVTHALSDIYAMGGRPVTALAVVTVPFATAKVTKNLLRQLLAGAVSQLKADGVELVGGHTSEGMELSLGFAVNGVVDKDVILNKDGFKDGDSLILTKALGTGAIFAADMQNKAKGVWVNSALQAMTQSNQQSLKIVLEHGVTACTDVTGFGLAGHLTEMIDASKRGVVLDMDKLPILEGARDVISRQGITSTLHESNRAASPRVLFTKHPSYELLFDPQTSGGLLVSLPSARADACVEALRKTGYHSAEIIGCVSDEHQDIAFSSIKD
ncbi:MAG: selenide, water dikinase SelD [Pseudomonadales bacterium]|jgi:selenide,water dikinase